MNGMPTEIGPIQRALIERAKSSKLDLLYITEYREMRAARKLVKRGVLIQQGALPLFWLDRSHHDVG
jgi:hypothetical protein